MFSSNPEKAEIRAYGGIGPWEGNISELDFQNAFDEHSGQDLTIHVQSDGGDVDSGISIYNQIANYPGKVTVVIDAMAASIASYFPMAATEVLAHENSTMMIHNPWTLAIGDANEMERVADVLRLRGRQLSKAYANRTGKHEDEILAIMDAETWLDADQMLAGGFIDGVISAKKAKPAAKAFQASALAVNPKIVTNLIAKKLRQRI